MRVSRLPAGGENILQTIRSKRAAAEVLSLATVRWCLKHKTPPRHTPGSASR